MRALSNVWLAIILGLFGLMAVGVLLALDRENIQPGDAIVTTGTPRSQDIAEWACPSGTDGKVTCGYVSLPADYDDPDGEQIRIFVATIGVSLEASGPPILFLGDSLGTGSVGDFADWRQIVRTLNREIILVDHRGTGLSEPQLTCIELGKVPWLEADLGSDSSMNAEREKRRVAINRCAERVAQMDGEPDFSSETILTDLEQVREALGIESWVVAASGEVVPLAAALAERDAEAVESMVLLRAALPSTDRFGERQDYAEEALAAALGCETSTCSKSAALRPLEGLRERLGPRSLVFTAEVDGARQRVSVNAGTVAPSLALGVIDETVRASLPDLIERVGDGQWRELASLRGGQFRTHDYPALPTPLSIGCSLPTTRRIDRVTGEEDPARFWSGLLDDPLLDDGICPPTTPITTMVSRPTNPVLIVNQIYDYLAPRTAAEELQRRWPEAQVEILDSGNAPSLTEECVLALVSEFLDVSPTMDVGCP